MKRRVAITLGVLAALAIGHVLVKAVIDISYQQTYTVRDRTMLLQVGHALQQLGDESKLTPEVLDSIDDTEVLTSLVGPKSDAGKYWNNDVRGEPYLLGKREVGDHVFLTIRSKYEQPRTWYRRESEVLGIEIAISRADGKVTAIKKLWRAD